MRRLRTMPTAASVASIVAIPDAQAAITTDRTAAALTVSLPQARPYQSSENPPHTATDAPPLKL